MRGITLTIDEIKDELKEKAPSYYTEDRLVGLTYNDAVSSLVLVNQALANGETDPFAPGEEGTDNVIALDQSVPPAPTEYVRDPVEGLVEAEPEVKPEVKKVAAKKTAKAGK